MRCGSMRREGGESWLALEQEQGSFAMSSRRQTPRPRFKSNLEHPRGFCWFYFNGAQKLENLQLLS